MRQTILAGMVGLILGSAVAIGIVSQRTAPEQGGGQSAPRSAAEAHSEPRSGKWPAVRKAHLLKEPACAACGGTDHIEVHHVLPFHKDPSLELLESNLVTLCRHPDRDCHLNIGHLGDYKSWNVDVRRDAAWWLKKRQGRPYVE